jgi:uroporphyrinogen-III synthase/SAM-dependent methyltransferase
MARGSGPLSGRRIVVTRSRAQAGQLRELLEAEGAEVIEFPTIRLRPLDDYAAVDEAIANIQTYDWIVFTSANGVAAFVERLPAHPETALAGRRLAAIGPGKARALESRGFHVGLAPDEFRAEALVEAFAREAMSGRRVLVPRAASARGVLPDGLRRLGATVDVVPVYQTEMERDHGEGVRSRLLSERMDAVTFTSSSTVRHFVDLLGPNGLRAVDRSIVACIGPVTAATARDCGIDVHVVASDYTLTGLVAALRSVLGGGISDTVIRSIRESYDRLADEYARRIGNELQHKPVDRALLDRFAARVAGRGDVCDMGCGPGHVARYLRDAGAAVFGLDLSPRMVQQARQLHPDISFREGNMTALDLRDGTLAGIAALYAIVNIPNASLPLVFREMERVLQPGGLLLLAFHIGDRVLHEHELWGRPISMDFFLFQPSAIRHDVEAAGFVIEEIIEREPYPPDVEYQSRRAYMFARKPGGVVQRRLRRAPTQRRRETSEEA